MKFVYVLTSSPKDNYYEQFFLSVASLRLYNQNAVIIVLLDQRTKDTLTNKRSGYEKYVSEIKTIEVPPEFSQKESSRWIKTSIRNYVEGDFLFIDCDTIIAGKLENAFPDTVKIGAVLDTHVILSSHHLRSYFQESDKHLGFVSTFNHENHFNGGLLFCRAGIEGEQFFEKWHFLWLQGRNKGNSQDMPSFNQANYELGDIIKELPGEWNCQISHNGLAYLYNSKIIHYYATSLVSFTPPFILSSDFILSSIKHDGIISMDILDLLEHPKTAFELKSRIIADESVIAAFDSSTFSKLIWLSKRHPSFFKGFDKIIANLTKFFKLVIRK
jgi:hypothetical protein